jgi:hypothetical protein
MAEFPDLTDKQIRASLAVVVRAMIADNMFPASDRYKRLSGLLAKLEPEAAADEVPQWLLQSAPQQRAETHHPLIEKLKGLVTKIAARLSQFPISEGLAKIISASDMRSAAVRAAEHPEAGQDDKSARGATQAVSKRRGLLARSKRPFWLPRWPFWVDVVRLYR